MPRRGVLIRIMQLEVSPEEGRAAPLILALPPSLRGLPAGRHRAAYVPQAQAAREARSDGNVLGRVGEEDGPRLHLRIAEQDGKVPSVPLWAPAPAAAGKAHWDRGRSPDASPAATGCHGDGGASSRHRA